MPKKPSPMVKPESRQPWHKDWLLLLWLAGGVWSLFCSGSFLFTPAIYAAGPLLCIGFWLLPLSPLVVFTWRRRFWHAGWFWRLFPILLVVVLVAITAPKYRVPSFSWDEHREWDSTGLSTYVTTFAVVLVPILSAALFLAGVLRTRTRAAA